MTLWTKTLLSAWLFLIATSLQVPQVLEGHLFPVASIQIEKESDYYTNTRVTGYLNKYRDCKLVSLIGTSEENQIDIKSRKEETVSFPVGINKIDWVVPAVIDKLHVTATYSCHPLWNTVVALN